MSHRRGPEIARYTAMTTAIPRIGENSVSEKRPKQRVPERLPARSHP
jgi:hypothetical protein